MVSKYYLGANSKDGFVSLYNEFPPDGSFLNIIKGGPGNGKSSFMRRIGLEAEKRDMDVEYVLCSGDSDSLDGVYIPELSQAWVDGTAPHVVETDIFAFNSVYEDLGRFCKRLDIECGKTATVLYKSYRQHYENAYIELKKCLTPTPSGEASFKLHDEAAQICSSIISPGGSGKVQKRFMSYIGKNGHSYLSEEISRHYANVICLNFSLSDSQGFFECITGHCIKQRQDIVICRSPINPDLAEGILVPRLRLAFLLSSYGIEDATEIYADKSYVENAISDTAKHEFALAKSEHDRLEALYRPYMDFKALNEYTEAVINSLFKNIGDLR